MPTSTYELIDSEILTGSAASVTFSSIPATFRDLVVVADFQHDSGGNANIRMRFNSDTGSNYSIVDMSGNGSATASGSDTSVNFGFLLNAYDNASKVLVKAQVMDYSATDKHKSILARLDKADERTGASAGRWANTAAITAIELSISADDFVSGSTFHLYGIVS